MKAIYCGMPYAAVRGESRLAYAMPSVDLNNDRSRLQTRRSRLFGHELNAPLAKLVRVERSDACSLGDSRQLAMIAQNANWRFQ